MITGVSMEEFEKIVNEALESLPEEFASQLDNVAVTIEDKPTPEDLERANIKNPNTLLFGLYWGVSKLKRGAHYSSLPDKITIFRDPIFAVSFNLRDAKRRIRNTVIHEIGHHFGMTEEQIRKALRE